MKFARAEDMFGGLPGEVAAGVVADPARREQIEVDVVVFAPAGPRRAQASPLPRRGQVEQDHGAGAMARLRRAKELLAAKGYDVRDTVPACYSGTGFDGALRDESDVRAIGLERLYG